MGTLFLWKPVFLENANSFTSFVSNKLLLEVSDDEMACLAADGICSFNIDNFQHEKYFVPCVSENLNIFLIPFMNNSFTPKAASVRHTAANCSQQFTESFLNAVTLSIAHRCFQLNFFIFSCTINVQLFYVSFLKKNFHKLI